MEKTFDKKICTYSRDGPDKKYICFNFQFCILYSPKEEKKNKTQQNNVNTMSNKENIEKQDK